MYRFNKIKQGILIVSLATLITGCGGGGGGSTATSTGTTGSYTSASAGTTGSYTSASAGTSGSNFSPTTLSKKALQSGQVKDSSTGKGLENVKVSIGVQTVITNADGFYTLSDLRETAAAVVTFEKDGYLLGSTSIQLKSLSEDNVASPNYLEYTMHEKSYQWDYNSNDEVYGANIRIDASVSYDSINKKSYNGTNTAELIIIDVTTDEGKTLFPGKFEGINSNGTLVHFDSYGLISILLKDSNGNGLRLAESETGTLRFDAVSSLEKPDTLPLWYYDYAQGIWFEEGYAQLQDDGSYKGEISHLGTWSLNRPLEEEAGIYRGRIVNTDGSPISDVRLQAIGENWISSDLSTDEDGVFEIEVIPGKSFKLSAYNYKDKYKASYNNTIPAIASGNIVED